VPEGGAADRRHARRPVLRVCDESRRRPGVPRTGRDCAGKPLLGGGGTSPTLALPVRRAAPRSSTFIQGRDPYQRDHRCLEFGPIGTTFSYVLFGRICYGHAAQPRLAYQRESNTLTDTHVCRSRVALSLGCDTRVHSNFRRRSGLSPQRFCRLIPPSSRLPQHALWFRGPSRFLVSLGARYADRLTFWASPACRRAAPADRRHARRPVLRVCDESLRRQGAPRRGATARGRLC
jgi:hypothetical protein